MARTAAAVKDKLIKEKPKSIRKPKVDKVLVDSNDAELKALADLVQAKSASIELNGQRKRSVYESGSFALDCALGCIDPELGTGGFRERSVVEVFGPPGVFKCLGYNTPIIMFDGTIKMVQDICVDDLLMGPDSSPRTVTKLHRGSDQLYEVAPVKGDSFICNSVHVLSLKDSYNHKRIDNIPLCDYLGKSNNYKHSFKLYRPSIIEFLPSGKLPLDPYYLGIWLGDGHANSHGVTTPEPEVVAYLEEYAASFGMHLTVKKERGCATINATFGIRKGHGKLHNPLKLALRKCGLLGNKHIPLSYLTASVADRMSLLAGLLDSDGHYDTKSNTFQITQKNERLTNDILFLCRSLGMAIYAKKHKTSWTYKGQKKFSEAFYMCVNGDIDKIPNKLPRKKACPRQQVKSNLVTGFSVNQIGFGDYYGFSLDGPDKLFLLGDFTVTHNTGTLEHAIVSVQKRGMWAFLLSSEEPDYERMQRVGIDLNKLQIINCYEPQQKGDTRLTLAESALPRLIEASANAKVGIIAIDSLKGLSSAGQIYEKGDAKKGKDRPFSASEMAIRARMMEKFFDRLKVKNQRAITFIVNQTNEKPKGDRFDDEYCEEWRRPKTSGGRRKEFEEQIRIEIESRAITEEEKHDMFNRRHKLSYKPGIGIKVIYRIRKNKFSPYQSERIAISDFSFDNHSFDRESEVLDYATYLDLIEQSGPWYVFEGLKFQGRPAVIDYFKENPDKRIALERQILPRHNELFALKQTADKQEPKARYAFGKQAYSEVATEDDADPPPDYGDDVERDDDGDSDE